MPLGGLVEAELVEHLLEHLAVLGAFDGFDAGADDGDAVGLESGGEVEGGLTAELDDDAVGLFVVADVEDVLEGERFEEKFVAGVVIGGDGLGVGVDHQGFVADFAEGEGGVDATVIEFDALADAVGAAAEDHDFLFGAAADFVEEVVVGGVVVRCVGLELGGAGVDEAVGGMEVEIFAPIADEFLGGLEGGGDLAVGEAEGLRFVEHGPTFGNIISVAGKDLSGGRAFEGVAEGVEGFFLVDEFLELGEEPGVDFGEVVDFVGGEAGAEGVADVEDALGVGGDELLLDEVAGGERGADAWRIFGINGIFWGLRGTCRGRQGGKNS